MGLNGGVGGSGLAEIHEPFAYDLATQTDTDFLNRSAEITSRSLHLQPFIRLS